jgi:hypothetical protein
MRKYYKTSDIYLAAFLLSESFPIKKITSESSKKYFHFSIVREPLIVGDLWTIDKAVKSYWDKSVAVKPLDIFNAFKELKNRIFNQ